ncbi:MAG: shikimate kinase [Bacteroidota bacterium]
MIIFLIGFMGSGKSTLGKRLAKKIGYDFVDMDYHIEEQEGMKVPAIFEKKGERYFRDQEKRFLEELEKDANLVVATGGGAPCFGKNIDIMNEKGITVYLKMSPSALASRLERARVIRPLVAGLESEHLRQYIENKLHEREPYYNQAKCIIRGESAKPFHITSLVFGTE